MPTVFLLLACASPPAAVPDDAHEYMRLLAAEDLSTAQRIEACLDLSDAYLAMDCALAAAEAAPIRGEGHVEDWCPRLPQGVWRDECLFQAAEQALSDRDRNRASRLCAEAGRFANDCGYHLWQVDLRFIIRRAGPAGFAEHLPEARKLYDVWAPRLAAHTDMEFRFWSRYFEMGFEPQPRIQLQACDALEEPYRARCRNAGMLVWRHRLENATIWPEAQSWFCARTSDAATVEALLAKREDIPPLPNLLAVTPTPELDVAVAKVRSSRCR
ncbi:MAG: hypothetical protein JXB39_07570 [Deltaproteobacteria bacterium]|nr:hypothetical protein [Deltaproteobacteria bacterium]